MLNGNGLLVQRMDLEVTVTLDTYFKEGSFAVGEDYMIRAVRLNDFQRCVACGAMHTLMPDGGDVVCS